MLSRDKTGLLVIDVQEKLFPHVERGCEVLHTIKKLVKGFDAFGLPIVVTEQYPEGLGDTVAALKGCLPDHSPIFPKTAFSCLGNSAAKQHILDLPIDDWVLTGFEAHVCILQTAKELLAHNKRVIVLNDAITSRSIFDYSTAIAELRDYGVRISSAETILFELLRDSQAAEFSQIRQLVK